mmetsp:Transcript_13077/g.31803  ORF Transcript_13077/g.31803 Transcript_13077/m.31803 type:complete len:215 (+) Transcript_13077:1814-2458(+)
MALLSSSTTLRTGVYRGSLAYSFRLRFAMPFCLTLSCMLTSMPCLEEAPPTLPATEGANLGPEPADATEAPPETLAPPPPAGEGTKDRPLLLPPQPPTLPLDPFVPFVWWDMYVALSSYSITFFSSLPTCCCCLVGVIRPPGLSPLEPLPLEATVLLLPPLHSREGVRGTPPPLLPTEAADEGGMSAAVRSLGLRLTTCLALWYWDGDGGICGG